MKYLFKKQALIFLLISVVCFLMQASQGVLEQHIIEKPIVVVTCMYNNQDWVLYNLNSIFMQEYSNFRVIVVDDGSQDQTSVIIKDYIETNNLSDQVTFIANQKRKRKLANLYHVLYQCADDEIVVMLDGDDWLAHEKIFETINNIYTYEDVWLTYGQYYNIPPEEAIKWGYSPKGYAAAMPKEQQARHEYRSGPFRFMHLRTFYGWLFKVVKLQDLLSETVVGFKGSPFPASNDLAMYYPMIETAHYRIRFVPEILYIRNLFSEIVGFKVDRKIQRASAQEIRKKKHYPVAQTPIYRNLEEYLEKPIAVIVLCEKNTEKLEEFLQSMTAVNNGLFELYLLCHYEIDKNLVDILEKKFGITIICFHYTEDKSLSKTLQQLLAQCCYEHVLFATFHYEKNHILNFQNAVYWLEKTYARSFHTGLQVSEVPTHSWIVPLDDCVYAWKISCARGIWRLANPLDGVLYRTKDIQKILADCTVKTISQLILLLKKDLYDNQSAVNLSYY